MSIIQSARINGRGMAAVTHALRWYLQGVGMVGLLEEEGNQTQCERTVALWREAGRKAGLASSG